jgi:uncharacterized membrane protein
MSPLRSVAAVLGGVVLLSFMDRILEGTLVSALADAPPADQASYLAVRNRPLVLAVTLITHTMAGVLAGYMTGRIAGGQETRHAVGAGAVLMAAYVWAFLLDNSMLPPVWVRIAMLIVTVPALVGGATIRAQARSTEAVTGGDRTNEGTP